MRPKTKKAAKARPTKVKPWVGWAIVDDGGIVTDYFDGVPVLFRFRSHIGRLPANCGDRVVQVRVEVIP